MEKVAFLHPDLGIGGAERLVVDAAVALKKKGHSVTLFTSHHGEKSFDETKDGTLPVVVHGDFLPRTFRNRFYIFFANIRALYLAFVVCVCYPHFDVIFCDQNAAYILILRLFSRSKILFYCHHPDFVQTPHKSLLKILYRLPFDWLEEYWVSMADLVLVNSLYTQSIYAKSYKVISTFDTALPDVLYPCVDFVSIRNQASFNCTEVIEGLEGCKYFISVNRYEKKKEVEKAILGFAALREKLGKDVYEREKLRLVIIGGYDFRLLENVEYYEKLRSLSIENEIANYVIFARNCSQELKAHLIQQSISLVYTPTNEHFGIVPLEAMALGRPVIADNSGGPMETILPGENGFLCNTWGEFGDAMSKFIECKDLADKLGMNGKERVESLFSFSTFSNELEKQVKEMNREFRPQLYIPFIFTALLIAMIYFYSS